MMSLIAMAMGQPTTGEQNVNMTIPGTGAPPAATGVSPSASTGAPGPSPAAVNGSCNPTDLTMLDSLCQSGLGLFQGIDPSAAIFPGIGLPSQNNGVCTITHTMGPTAAKLKINGLISNSPLSNNALFSFECAVLGSSGSDNSTGMWLNLYEVMVADFAKTNGMRSAGQTYINKLFANGLDVTATHYHWTGSDLNGQNFVIAVHHQNIGLAPADFIGKTSDALKTYVAEMPSAKPSM